MFSLLTPLKSILFLGAVAGGVGLPALNYEYIPRKKGHGEAKNPRLRISQEGSKTELSFDANVFFGGGEKKEKNLDFNAVKMSFDGKLLSQKDVFCSPKQNGVYVLMRHVGGRNYRVDGMSKDIIGCHERYISKSQMSTLKTFKLDWQNRHLRKMTPSLIAIGSCKFIFKPSIASWQIILRGCQDSMSQIGLREIMDDKILGSADYLLN